MVGRRQRTRYDRRHRVERVNDPERIRAVFLVEVFGRCGVTDAEFAKRAEKR